MWQVFISGLQSGTENSRQKIWIQLFAFHLRSASASFHSFPATSSLIETAATKEDAEKAAKQDRQRKPTQQSGNCGQLFM